MIEVTPYEGGVHIRFSKPERGLLRLSWPETNKLQADLRKLCVEAGITMRGLP